MKQLRICIFGHSGSGKSTAARYILERFQELNYSTEVLKLAEPLYRLQAQIYRIAGRPIDHYAQDQQLLEFLARELRRINPHSLVEDFDSRLTASYSQVVVCDDLRDKLIDFSYLKEKGFVFINIKVDPVIARHRLQQRQDLSIVIDSPVSKELDSLDWDYQVTNSDEDHVTFQRRLDSVFLTLLSKSGVEPTC